MKKLLFILLCLPMIGFGQLTYVPDDNFESYLESNGMGNGIADDSVNTASIDTVTFLDVSGQSIYDLTGIEAFTDLTYLNCYANNLSSSLNLSNNIALIELNIADNNISSLDLSANTSLEKLVCYFNHNLYILDISNNTALTYLECESIGITNLDLSNNTSLTYLDCNDINLTSLDVSTNTLLEELHCSQNQLTSLDVSNNPQLEELNCFENQLISLDVSANILLDELGCAGNQITNLNVSTNTALIYLECQYNNLTSLDVSISTSIKELYCFNNNLTNLDVSTNVLLEELGCGNNQLTNLDIRNGNNSNLDWLDCTNTPNLTCINVDDVSWSTANWTLVNGNIDPQHYFSNNCSVTLIEEHTTNKELLRTTDVLGRETKNNPLFYIYDDGTVEKRIVIE